jgi:hypothetical protein
MKLGFQNLVCLGLPVLLYACGSDTPSFVEKPEALITLTVSNAAVDDDAFDMDELLSDENEGLPADESAAVIDVDEMDDASPAKDKGKGQGKGNKKSKDKAIASNDGDLQSADATPVSNTPDYGDDTGSTPDIAYDAKAVAKACQPYFRGLAQKIKVVDSLSLSNLNVAPGTLIAFKVTSNHTKLSIHLPAGNDLPGVCFFVSGNQATVQFSTASKVDGFAYIAAGNQSNGVMEFLGGSPVRSHIELKGHEASLDVLGLDHSLCQAAVLKGSAPRFQCNP